MTAPRVGLAGAAGLSGRLPLTHVLLALMVVAVWGTNFVVIKVALAELPPLLLGALRFFLSWFPALLFIPRPAVPWRKLAAYGLLIGVGQFGLLYIALTGFISPGLASLVIQLQVFFTIGLALVMDGERMRALQALALVLATAGIVVIAMNTGGDVTWTGLLLTLLGAACWASGNQVARSMGRVQTLGVVVWSSAIAWPVLLLLALVFEGPGRLWQGLQAAGVDTWAAVLWQAVGNSLFGYAAWGWLLARHPAATVVPMALLVPVFGMGSSALLLGESLPTWKLGAAAAVMLGLGVNLLWPQRR